MESLNGNIKNPENENGKHFKALAFHIFQEIFHLVDF